VVRPLTDAERQARTTGLRSADAGVLRRGHILLASARGARAPRLAEQLGGDDQTVRDALHAFTAPGLPALQPGSSRPHRPPPPAFPGAQAAQWRARRHRRPRACGPPARRWTRDWAAAVRGAPGFTPRVVRGAAVRQPLRRLGIGWQRATQWMTSPDPADGRKTGHASA
jgi:hypothetical protein